MIQKLITAFVLLITAAPTNAQIGFEAVFGGALPEWFKGVIATSDGGVLACGGTKTFGLSDITFPDGYIVKSDASGDELWFQTFGTSNNETAEAAIENADGYMVVGINVPDYPVTYDFYLVQYDHNGNILWDAFYGGTSGDYCYDIIPFGNEYVLCGGSSSFTFGSLDMYAVKIDASGSVLEDGHFGDTGTELANAMVKTSDGGFVLVGYTNSGTIGYDIYAVKTDSDLNQVWEQNFGGNFDDIGFDVEEDANGNLWILGFQETAPDSSYMVLIQTDANGQNAITHHPGKQGGDFGYRLHKNNNGEFLISGVTNVFGKGSELLLEKLDSNGDTLWTRHYGGSKNEVGYGITTNEANEIIIAGETEGFGVENVDGYILYVDADGNIPCPPSVSFIMGDDACVEELAYFTNTTVSSQEFSWSINGNTFSDNVDAAYYFTDPGNADIALTACGITSTQSIDINEKPPVNFTYSVSGNMVSFFLNPVITVESVSWNFGDGSPVNTIDANPTHTYSNPGMYWIVVSATDDHGCDSTFAAQIYLSTGVEAIGDSKLNLFPNPAHGFVIIEGVEKPLKLKILDAHGAIISQSSVSLDHYKLEISHLKAGLYLLHCMDESGRAALRKLEVH